MGINADRLGNSIKPHVLECGTCEHTQWKEWLENQIIDLECQVKILVFVASGSQKPLWILSMGMA